MYFEWRDTENQQLVMEVYNGESQLGSSLAVRKEENTIEIDKNNS